MFLKTPKGVVPTARALELADPVAELLARARSIIATAEPFEPASSRRRFTIGAPDGVSAVFLPPVLAEVQRSAPGVDLSVRQLLPTPGEASPARAWQFAFGELEARAMDIAIVPASEIPARFLSRTIYDEDFIITVRAGHSFADEPTLKRYCQMQHLVVSHSGEAHGFVDEVLAARGYSRRIALTVPNFMFALAIIAETDLISALPRRLVAMHALRFGVVGVEAPLPLGRFSLNAVAPKVAVMDAGLAWLYDMLGRVRQGDRKSVKPKRSSHSRRPFR